MAIIAATHELGFLRKEKVAKDTYTFFFEKHPVIDFMPGQFMRLTLNLPQPSARGNGRFFSIASSPTEKDFLMITIRTSPQIYKSTLLNLKPGEKVRISLPFGQFILNPAEVFPHVFLAGGIGITPFRSMIKYAADSGLNIPITLFTSFKTVDDIVFREELHRISEKNNWLKLIDTITQPEASGKNWQGVTGRIDIGLIKKNVPDIGSATFYIAGPPGMVDALGVLLKSAGVSEKQIRKERFTGY